MTEEQELEEYPLQATTENILEQRLSEMFVVLRMAQKANQDLADDDLPAAVNVGVAMAALYESVCVNLYMMVNPEHRDSFCEQLQEMAAKCATLAAEHEERHAGNDTGHA
jgi:hypothetical protein